MKISIITVCYNSEKTIEATLQSVLSQTYTNYEYLIIDGKSTDNTINIINDYEKRFKGKLKYFSDKDNGIYDAMNKGIKLATGDIIGIINSDDILAHENVFKNIVENIGDCDGIYSNLLMLDNNLIKPYRLFKSKKVSKKLAWHPPHPTLYLKKEVYEKCGVFNLKYKVTADFDFMLRIINNGIKLKYLDDYFVFMRSGGASTAGLKGYYNNFKESYKVLKNNTIRLPYLTNVIRIFKTFSQRIAIIKKNEIYKAKHLSKKPKLVQINTVCNESTGKIMRDIQKEANQSGFQTLSIYGRRKGYSDLNCIKVGGFFSFWTHVAITTLFDLHGHGSYFKTKKIVKILRKENPDIIHLHNVHGYYLNLPILFNYLKNEYKGKIFWTLHDCWTFTGHCSHFILADCYKWKDKCYKCPNKKKYPISLFKDNSHRNYLNKKKMFTDLKNLTLITPSDWLTNLVKKSFLKDYKIITINNGIDLSVFKPTLDNDIKYKYNLPNNKKILLGVASIWTESKGLNEFIRLSKEINDSYVIVLVGLNEAQIKKLKKYKNIIGVKKTENVEELVKLYTIAECFINPSKEETFSLVTIESIACGTPVIAYNGTPMVDLIKDNCGIITDKKITFDLIKMIDKNKVDNSYIKKYDNSTLRKNIVSLYKSSEYSKNAIER